MGEGICMRDIDQSTLSNMRYEIVLLGAQAIVTNRNACGPSFLRPS